MEKKTGKCWNSKYQLIFSITSSYSKKQIWMSILKKIQERSHREVKQSQAHPTPILQGFSDPVPMYYNGNSKNGDYFGFNPSVAKLPPIPRGSIKVCNSCGTKLSFISNRLCSICERSFCKNCCAERILLGGKCLFCIM